MKKALLLMLALGSPLFADIAVTPGSGKTVATITNSSREFQQVSAAIDGSSNTVTIGGTAFAITTVTFNGAAQPISGTVTVVPGATNIVVTSSSTLPVSLTGNQAVNLAQVGANTVVTGGVNGSVGVGGVAATGAAASGNPVYVAGFVSSTTYPTQQVDGDVMPILVDQMGRIITAGGVAPGNFSSTSSVNGAAINTELILISSAAANNYVYMCGCLFDNTSATNVSFVLYQTTSPFFTAGTGEAFPIGAPANMVNGGIWPGCDRPFFKSKVAGQITIKPSTTATSIPFHCQYFKAP